MKKLISMMLMLLSVIMVGCSNGDKIEKAFGEYAKNENIPNYNGINKIECTDSLPFDELAAIPKIESQIDSIKKLLDAKIQDLTSYYGGLSYAKKQQLGTEYARIGAEYGELCVNDIDNDEPINTLKDALEDLSPYRQPLYVYHIIAKVGTQDISYFAFSVGDDITFVKAEDKSDAMRKNKKLCQFQDAMMNVVRTKFVPRTMLIDDIDKFIGNGSN